MVVADDLEARLGLSNIVLWRFCISINILIQFPGHIGFCMFDIFDDFILVYAMIMLYSGVEDCCSVILGLQ